MAQKIILSSEQNKMVKASEINHLGYFQGPTAIGKTFAQAEIVRRLLIKGFSVSVIKSPRISLSNQLASEYLDYIDSKNSIEFEKFLVHSGERLDYIVDEDDDFEEQLEAMKNASSATDTITSTNLIKDRVSRARALNIPVVIFTTYNSNIKVAKVLKQMSVDISLDINDEAHYLVREDFSTILDNVNEDYHKPKRQYFFTATPKYTNSNQGRGMNNEQRFGKAIYELSIARAIELGYILPAFAETINCTYKIDKITLDDNIGDIVLVAFNRIREVYTGLGSKLLVASKGSGHMRTFINSDEYQLLVSEGVNILTVHSIKELITYNGEVITRKEFDRLKIKLGKDLTSEMIIVHYDIISEGIDIPGLLGVLILRNMQEAKFFQTIGRALRLLRSNPKLKEFGMVMFPNIADPDMTENFKHLLNEMKKLEYLSSQSFNEMIDRGIKQADEIDLTEETTYNNSSNLNLSDSLYTQSVDFSDFTSGF